MKIVEMENQEVYLKNTFGLRTMKEDGRLRFVLHPNVTHLEWVRKDQNMMKIIIHLF
jgi:hypothetical protein